MVSGAGGDSEITRSYRQHAGASGCQMRCETRYRPGDTGAVRDERDKEKTSLCNK